MKLKEISLNIASLSYWLHKLQTTVVPTTQSNEREREKEPPGSIIELLAPPLVLYACEGFAYD